MVEDAPVAGSLNAMLCSPSAMAGAAAITRLAEAASTGVFTAAMLAVVSLRKPRPWTVIAVRPFTRAREGTALSA